MAAHEHQNEYNARFKEKQQRMGMKLLRVWVPEKDVHKVTELAKALRDAHKEEVGA